MCRGGSSIDEKVVDSSPRREAEVEHVLCEFTGHGCALVVILTLNYCLVLNRLYYTSPDLIGCTSIERFSPLPLPFHIMNGEFSCYVPVCL